MTAQRVVYFVSLGEEKGVGALTFFVEAIFACGVPVNASALHVLAFQAHLILEKTMYSASLAMMLRYIALILYSAI
jgi:hypothetical protein